MSRKKNKSKSNKKFAKTRHRVVTLGGRNDRKLKLLLSIFVGSGMLMVALTVSYQYFFGNVVLEYIQPVGRAYEFQLSNDTPTDKVIKVFSVQPPPNQQIVFITTKDVYGIVDKDGLATLPGGNSSYIPAAEFNELDGQSLVANSAMKFRIPPLSNRSWMEPEAIIVDILFELESANYLLKLFEKALDFLQLRSSEHMYRYLVVNNYWIRSNSSSIGEAMRIYCRDNDDGLSGVCR